MATFRSDLARRFVNVWGDEHTGLQCGYCGEVVGGAYDMVHHDCDLTRRERWENNAKDQQVGESKVTNEAGEW